MMYVAFLLSTCRTKTTRSTWVEIGPSLVTHDVHELTPRVTHINDYLPHHLSAL